MSIQFKRYSGSSEQEKSVTITENGTTEVTPDSGKVLSKVSIVTNISATTPTEEKTVDLSMESGNQVIMPTSGKSLPKVTVKKPASLLPGNIKNNVYIGGVRGSLQQPTLYSPTISLSGDILTITNSPNNGKFVSGYNIYKNNDVVTTSGPSEIDLSKYIKDAGTYSITVKAANFLYFNDSAASNAVTYTLQAQTTPVISLVSGTTIQIDTIDDNAQTIEVYADGTKIGEVTKQ